MARTGAALGAAAAAGVATLAYAHTQTLSFQLREHTLAILPAGQSPLRVLHISDIHMAPGQDSKTLWLRSLAALEPDLVVNTGDNLSHPQAIGPLLNALEPLLRFPGLFVPGSNCYYAPSRRNPLEYLLGRRDSDDPARRKHGEDLDWEAMHLEFSRAGWANATNRAFSMPVHGLRLDVSGVDDPHLRRDRMPGWPVGSASGAASPHLRLALTHAPYRRVLDTFVRSGADLVLAGHTHGGQLAVPAYGALVSNCDLPTGMASGLHWWSAGGLRAPLNVSAGAGSSRTVPFRVACPPEASLLTLVPRESA